MAPTCPHAIRKLGPHPDGNSVHVLPETACLNEPPFTSLRHAGQLIRAWRDDHTHHRPHSSLDGLTPREYHQRSRADQTLYRATQ